MYNINKRIGFSNTTVERLIEELSMLPKDAQVLCGGTVDLYLHVDDENNIVSIDYDALEAYYEGSDEKGVTKDEEVILLLSRYVGDRISEPIDLSKEISIPFPNKITAKYCLICLEELIREFGYATVMDLFDISSMGTIRDYRGNLYGWTDLSECIMQNQNPRSEETTLILPKPMALREEG